MADTVDLIIKSATTFYNQLKADQNGRYRSWEYCYKCFHDARNNSDPDYDDCLFGLECTELKREEVQECLSGIEAYMMDYYDNIRKEVKETEVKNKLSTTLITKILMGTFGCVPAYDRYFIDGIKDQKVTTGNYNIKSLLGLVDFYEDNRTRLEKTRKALKVYDLPYPQMKLLDMGFWQIGFEKDANKGLQIPH